MAGENDIRFELVRQGGAVPADRGLEAWSTKLQQGLAVSMRSLPAVFREQLVRVADLIASRNNGRWPSAGVGLSRRSGSLLESLRQGVSVSGVGDRMEASLGGVAYLGIQEFGGTVVARGARYLAIPLPAALDDRGEPLRDSPQDWDNTFIQRSKAGNLLIFRRDGTGIIPLYALKTSTRIPPRLGARDVLRQQMPYFTSRILDTVLAGVTG